MGNADAESRHVRIPWMPRILGMSTEQSKSALDNSVPKARQADRLSEGEKKSLELGELAEHEQGAKREELQRQARRAARKEE